MLTFCQVHEGSAEWSQDSDAWCQLHSRQSVPYEDRVRCLSHWLILFVECWFWPHKIDTILTLCFLCHHNHVSNKFPIFFGIWGPTSATSRRSTALWNLMTNLSFNLGRCETAFERSFDGKMFHKFQFYGLRGLPAITIHGSGFLWAPSIPLNKFSVECRTSGKWLIFQSTEFSKCRFQLLYYVEMKGPLGTS